MRIVCISDTHGRPMMHPIPEGDILVHAGDLTMSGTMREIPQEAYRIGKFKKDGGFKAAVVIPGNHDWLAERDPALMREVMEENGLIYLQHQPAVVEGLRFFGSGYTPRFFDWALNVDRGPELARLWAQIPDDTQVLVTHGPPWGRLDTVKRPGGEMDAQDFGAWGRGDKSRNHQATRVGCLDMFHRIQNLKDLKLHVFGHIHRPGMEKGADGITYVNASSCNESYDAVHKPQVVEIP